MVIGGMTWQTAENLSLLARLASQGKSSGFIAWQMGSECTRNAVIGYCSRNGIRLKGKRGGERENKRPAATKTQRRNFGWRVKKPPKSQLRSPLEDPTLSDPKWSCFTSISLMDALPSSCRWPVHGQRCCGKTIVCGSVYCPYHYQLSYIKNSSNQRLIRV